VQSRTKTPIREVSYAELRSGSIDINGKKVKTSALSSYYKARQIAEEVKKQVMNGEFLLTQLVQGLPAEKVQKPLELHTREEVE
jgi:uncharacterized protein (DUF39 family)